MCPIHDTDTAEERWSKAEWEHYELWEKLEARHQRRRRWVVLAAWVLFFVLSAVPIVMERSSQWLAVQALRELAVHLTELKREAGTRQLALLLEVDSSAPLSLRVGSAADCSAATFPTERMLSLLPAHPHRAELGWLNPAQGSEVGIPGLLSRFCYDPRKGSSVTPGEESVAAFALHPVKDLTASPERTSLLLLRGPSAEISFE